MKTLSNYAHHLNINKSPINNINTNNSKQHDNQVTTLFLDGCVHKMNLVQSILLGNFIESPYLGENDYKMVVYRDYMKIKNIKDLKFGTDAIRSLTINNAGGNSTYSEALSIHYFDNIFKAKDFILEEEVEYWKDYKMVDYICTINDLRIGVSVTRAMGFPTVDKFKKNDAETLLKRKINGLIVACDLVVDKYSFNKSILHIWCQNEEIADMVQEAYEKELRIDSMGLKVLCDVIVILTICDDNDIYYNPRRRNRRKRKVKQRVRNRDRNRLISAIEEIN